MLNQVFARDGYRCVITGLIDRASMKSIAELRRENERLRSAPIGVIACHILNESTTRGIGASEAVVNEVCTVAESSISIRSPHPLPRHTTPLVL